MDGRLGWVLEGLIFVAILWGAYWCIGALVKKVHGKEIRTTNAFIAIMVVFYVGRRMLLS